MADKELTYNDIKKALEYCKDCSINLNTEILDFIDRLQRKLKASEQGKVQLRDMLDKQQAEIKRLETLAELGNMRANDYRVMRNRAIKAEAEIERLKEDVSFGQRTCKEWAETCDELTEKLNGAIAGQETLQKALAEKNAEIERLKDFPKCAYAFDGEVMDYCLKFPCSNFKTENEIKVEATKEFAEDFEEEFFVGGVTYSITKEEFDEFIKRKVGED